MVECSFQDRGQSSSVFVRAITQEESGKDSEAGSPEIPLQTRTVDLAEVLWEVAFWIPSWREEYESLVSIHKAVRPWRLAFLMSGVVQAVSSRLSHQSWCIPLRREVDAARLVLSVAVTLRLGSISEKGRRMLEESVQPRCVQY